MKLFVLISHEFKHTVVLLYSYHSDVPGFLDLNVVLGVFGYIIYHDPMQKFYSWNSNQISLANAMEVERMNNSDRTQLGGSLLIKVILALVEDSGNITYCAASFKL